MGQVGNTGVERKGRRKSGGRLEVDALPPARSR